MRDLPPDEEQYPEDELLPEEFPAESVDEIYPEPEDDFYDEDEDEEGSPLPIDPIVMLVILLIVAL